MKLGDRGNKYKRITKEQRMKVIQLVMRERMTIRGAADALNLGASTARMIVKKFQKTGQVFEPKIQRREATEVEEKQEDNSAVLIKREVSQQQQKKQNLVWIFYPLMQNMMCYPSFI